MQLEVLCPSCFSPQLFETSQLWHQIYELLFIRSVTSDSFWTAAHQASLSFTIFQSLLKLMPIESVMPSSHNVLHCPLFFLPSIFSSIRIFFSESALHVRFAKILELQHQFLPMSIQGWFLLRLTGLISLQSRGVSRVLQHCSSKASIL